MSKVAIRATNVSKRYRIGAREQMNSTFVDAVVSVLKSPLRNFRQLQRLTQFDQESEDTLWALKDISFEIKQGEVVGIIGRNGAGKSTLLKVLSRITRPTNGTIELYGRVSSLLEVGTGFHPELTGRENIYLNGTILGMTSQEIDSKFDEIVDFAGVDRFIDTPVKRFSSGMQVRLAFAVAAHLEPEILIVDEVLAVGDVEFQRKCIGKMEDVAESGRTVLFVSHNMSIIQDLCEKGILLDKGEVKFTGQIDETIQQYLALSSQITLSNYQDLSSMNLRDKNRIPIIKSVQVGSLSTAKDVIVANQPFDIIVEVEPEQLIEEPALGITIVSMLGNNIFSIGNHYSGFTIDPIIGKQKMRVRIEKLPLLPGTYQLNLGFGTKQNPLLDAVYRAITFDVISHEPQQGFYRLSPNIHGAINIRDWNIELIKDEPKNESFV